MPIFRIEDNVISPLQVTSFALEGVREREHLQKIIRDQIEIIAQDTLVISEEFGGWQDSKRRIDLLAVDKDANLVIIELKRTEDGGHMDLQSIRYAAMASTLTFAKAVGIYQQHLEKLGSDDDANAKLLEFFDWDEPDEDSFGQDVKILLASAEFSKEITTSVIWLNDHGLDIRCIRLKPYRNDNHLLLDVEQIIPLPEAAEYQIQLRDKVRQERSARQGGRGLTKYDVEIEGELFKRLPKRRAIYQIVKFLCKSGVDPEEIAPYVPWNSNVFRYVDGQVDSEKFVAEFIKQDKALGKKSGPSRYFCKDHQLIHANGKTYALTKMWGRRTAEAMDNLINKWDSYEIHYSESAS